MKELYRQIPKMDDLLDHGKIEEKKSVFSQELIKESINETLMQTRAGIKEGTVTNIDIEEIIKHVLDKLENEDKSNLKRVINATGVVIHTNLGRSLLPQAATDGLVEVTGGYSNLEFDLETGKRGSRYSHVEDLITKLTKAEAAVVVNNNAAAVLLVLNTMCENKEVIVSRGELVEIGGSFRIPEVMNFSNAKLIEVGTTNKTHVWDYEKAITEETGALLKVHTSNYRIMGFTDNVKISDMKEVGNQFDIPVIEDLGSGSLVDLSKFGLTKEPTVQESIEAGADVVTISGDKMLGGPQIGIIIGKKQYIDQMKKNNLLRALRVDKMTLYTLENLLKVYLNEDRALKEIPTLRMLTMKKEDIQLRAENFVEQMNKIKSEQVDVRLIDGDSEVGGGSMPLEKLPTKLIAITFKNHSVDFVQKQLMKQETPVITRIKDNQIIIDFRTVQENEATLLLESFRAFIK